MHNLSKYLFVCFLFAMLVLAACNQPSENADGADAIVEVTTVPETEIAEVEEAVAEPTDVPATATEAPTETAVPPTEAPTETPEPTNTPTVEPTATETNTPTPEATETPEPTNTPAPTNTPQATAVPPTPIPPTAAPVAAHTFPETPIRPFNADEFIRYLGLVRDSYRSFNSEMDLFAQTGKPGDCGTFIGWTRLWILEAPGYTDVPADWQPLYTEYRSIIKQVVNVTAEIRPLCNAQGGELSKETTNAIIDFVTWAYPRSEAMVAEANSIPK